MISAIGKNINQRRKRILANRGRYRNTVEVQQNYMRGMVDFFFFFKLIHQTGRLQWWPQHGGKCVSWSKHTHTIELCSNTEMPNLIICRCHHVWDTFSFIHVSLKTFFSASLFSMVAVQDFRGGGSVEPISSHLRPCSYRCWLSPHYFSERLLRGLMFVLEGLKKFADACKQFLTIDVNIQKVLKRSLWLFFYLKYCWVSLITRCNKIINEFLPAAGTRGKMSLSRNGTLEKRDHSERGTPSRAGSGVVVPPPYSAGGSEAANPPLELRGSLDCWACSVLVTVQNMIIALINASLASIVFGTILTPALTMIIFGFLCHSTVQTPLCC